MQQQPQHDLSMFSFRVDAVEKDVAQIKMQLNLYETTRENELKQKQNDLRIDSLVNSVADMKADLAAIRKDVSEVKSSQITGDNTLQQSLDRIQIRTLLWFVLWFLGIIGSIFVGYVTHIFH